MKINNRQKHYWATKQGQKELKEKMSLYQKKTKLFRILQS